MRSTWKVLSVVFLGFAVFAMKSKIDPLSSAKARLSAAEQAKQDAERKQMQEAYKRHQMEVKKNDIKWEKIKWKEARHFSRDESGHVVPTNTDLDDSWFQQGRDGQAGLKDGQYNFAPQTPPPFPGE